MSAINHVPLAGDVWGFPFTIEGRPPSRPGESPYAVYRVVLPGYFRTMGISLLRGRDITESDNVNAPGVVIVNDRMARSYWPGEDPIGKRITLDDSRKNPTWLTVIGVTQDAKQDEWTARRVLKCIFPCCRARTTWRTLQPLGVHHLVTRTTGDPAALANDVKSAIAAHRPQCCSLGDRDHGRSRGRHARGPGSSSGCWLPSPARR